MATGFRGHRKTKALIARLGDAGVKGLLWLWLGVRDSRPDGNLAGWSAEDVELEADWRGEPGHFVRTLLDLKWLDGTPGAADFRVHDWPEHQGYAVKAPHRKAVAKHAAHRRHGVTTDPDCGVCSPLAGSQPEASPQPAPAPDPAPIPEPAPVPSTPPSPPGGVGGMDPKTPEAAWQVVQKALKVKRGPGQRLRDLMPPAVWAVVEVIGVDEVTEPKNRAATRAHFLRFYQAHLREAK